MKRLVFLLIFFVGFVCQAIGQQPNTSQSDPSPQGAQLQNAELIDDARFIAGDGSKRAHQFEVLRQLRAAALREIDHRNQRLRAIDSELTGSRNRLSRGFPAIPSVGMSSVGRVNEQPTRSVERIQLEISSGEKVKERRLIELKKDKVSDDDIRLDAEMQSIEHKLAELRLEIKENQENKKQEEAAIKQSQENAKEYQREFEEAKSRADAEQQKVEESISSLTREQAQLQKEVAEWSAKLDNINFRAIRLIDVSDAEGDFRTMTSGVFAVLVLVVIVGFFYIAHTDSKVRFAIFAHDSGIQFITLFSIVIAVILFGIIGVLEGKELSALLGGLSGYILGKHSATGPLPFPDDTPSGDAARQGRIIRPL